MKIFLTWLLFLFLSDTVSSQKIDTFRMLPLRFDASIHVTGFPIDNSIPIAGIKEGFQFCAMDSTYKVVSFNLSFTNGGDIYSINSVGNVLPKEKISLEAAAAMQDGALVLIDWIRLKKGDSLFRALPAQLVMAKTDTSIPVASFPNTVAFFEDWLNMESIKPIEIVKGLRLKTIDPGYRIVGYKLEIATPAEELTFDVKGDSFKMSSEQCRECIVTTSVLTVSGIDAELDGKIYRLRDLILNVK